jgi:hypothetical protein
MRKAIISWDTAKKVTTPEAQDGFRILVESESDIHIFLIKTMDKLTSYKKN